MQMDPKQMLNLLPLMTVYFRATRTLYTIYGTR